MYIFQIVHYDYNHATLDGYVVFEYIWCMIVLYISRLVKCFWIANVSAFFEEWKKCCWVFQCSIYCNGDPKWQLFQRVQNWWDMLRINSMDHFMRTPLMEACDFGLVFDLKKAEREKTMGWHSMAMKITSFFWCFYWGLVLGQPFQSILRSTETNGCSSCVSWPGAGNFNRT